MDVSMQHSFNYHERRTGAVPGSPLIFRFQQKSETGGGLFSVLGINFPEGDAATDQSARRKKRARLQASVGNLLQDGEVARIPGLRDQVELVVVLAHHG